MTDGDPVVPQGARPYQGTNAGVATRVAAAAIDVVLVALGLLAGYGGYVGLRLLLDKTMPGWAMEAVAFRPSTAGYARSISGRSRPRARGLR